MTNFDTQPDDAPDDTSLCACGHMWRLHDLRGPATPGDIFRFPCAVCDCAEFATAPDDPLRPPISLLIKLGSIIVHADEFLSPNGHPFDKMAFENGLQDGEVQRWIQQMTKLAFLPVKREAK